MVMFNHGRKLSELPFSSKYSLEEKKSVFTRMSQCFLTALNALSLLDPERAFFVAQKSHSNAFEKDDGFESDVEIIDINQIRKCYYLALASLTLHNKNTQLAQSFQLPNPEDVYTIYAANFQFDSAIQIAALYAFRLDKIVSNCVRAIIQIMNHRPWYMGLTSTFSYKEDAHKMGGNLLSQAWLTLNMILKEHDNPKELYPYHQLAIQKLLKFNSEIPLPKWLIEPFSVLMIYVD
jgi:hypothetical protein